MTARHQQFINEAVTHVKNIVKSADALTAMQKPWNRQSYGTTLPEGAGMNEGVLAADIGAAIFAGTDGLQDFLASPVGGNLTKLI